MASQIPIIVQGNSFSLAIPLQIYYINGDQMDLQDYTPDPTDDVTVQLKGSRRNYTYSPTIDGNVANIDLSGNELADNYSVVVSIVKANGQRLRSFRTDQFFIVESSDNLTQDDIIAGLEENVIYLNAQAFIAGADGRGIQSILKTGTSGLVDTYTIYYTDNTTSTFDVTNGAQGAQGVGITSIEKTSTSGLVDTYTITLSNGNTSTFEVTNGKDGVDLGLVEIADDLTTDDATQVLSARQGVVLNEQMQGTIKASFVDNKLVLTPLDTQSASIIISELTKQSVVASAGGTDTSSFTIQGTQITQAITISLSDTTNFSVSPSSISAPQGGTLAETAITITYAPASGTQTGTTQPCVITITYNGATISTLNITGLVAERKAEGSTFTVSDLIYTVLENTSNVSVKMTSTTLPTGAVVIPATVNDENGVSYNVTEIPADGFKKNTKITSLTLPEGLTTIGADAIRENSLLETLNIPNSVTSLGNNNTYKCVKLTNVTIGSGITELPEYFYASCGSDKSVVIPDNIVSTANYAFNGTGFTAVTIGSNFTTFKGTTRFKMQTGSIVTIKATTPPTIQVGYPFGYDASGQYVAPYKSEATLYVPSSAVSTYQSAKPWGTADNSGNGMFTDNNQIQATTE